MRIATGPVIDPPSKKSQASSLPFNSRFVTVLSRTRTMKVRELTAALNADRRYKFKVSPQRQVHLNPDNYSGSRTQSLS